MKMLTQFEHTKERLVYKVCCLYFSEHFKV